MSDPLKECPSGNPRKPSPNPVTYSQRCRSEKPCMQIFKPTGTRVCRWEPEDCQRTGTACTRTQQ